MTREEMITKLGDWLRVNFWGKEPYEMAFEILTFLEDEGMEPPNELFQDIDRNGERRINGNNGDYINHWETEQEIDWKKKNEKK